MVRTFTTRALRRDEMRRDAPLAAAIESFFNRRHNIRPKTEEFYRQRLTEYWAWVSAQQGREPIISDVEPYLVDAFLREVKVRPTKKYPMGSPYVARAASVTLKVFAKWLSEDNIMRADDGGSVLRSVKLSKPPTDARQPLSQGDWSRVLLASGKRGSRDYALLVLLAGTGLRLNEVRELRVADLDLRNRSLNVRAETSKFGRGRTVYFHNDVAAELDRYLADRQTLETDPLFPTDEGRFFTADGFGKVFQRIKERSGVPTFSAHILRHTWATNYMRNPNASLLELKRQGGWERWEMLDRYSHATPPRDRDALPNPTRPLAGQTPVRGRGAVNRLSA
jgi:integrase